MSEPLTILIAEDSPADRLLLSTILTREGHRVLTAANGQEAVTLFEQERPDLVLMDAMMPVMDGFEAARQIKQSAGQQLVPLIFLTSLTGSEELARCLEAGGDDFLAKPYNRLILQAKINAMARLRRLQATVLEQRDLIARHNEHLLNEQRVAKAVFDKVAHSGSLNAANVRYLQSPFALFNGDLLLAAFKPSGGMHVLLGDFTGHGLPAAIGAMPLAEVFYAMTAKGYSMAEILREMNAKLKRILPVGVFCCATMLNLSFQRRLVEVWNGGLPDGYLLRLDGELQPLASRHVPLGILSADAFKDACEVYPLELGERIVLLSDGVLETGNQHGEMFGERRFLDVLRSNSERGKLFEEIQQALTRFNGSVQDDVTLLEVSMVDGASLQRPLLDAEQGGPRGPTDWRAQYEYRAQTLRHFNPLPQLMQMLMAVDGLRLKGGVLYTVLAELYSNALEHGVMGLDSAMKQGASGFAQYYQERNRRLQTLEDGFVCFCIDVSPTADGGRLRLEVSDSGAGFNVEQHMPCTTVKESLSGRGLSLIRQLADHCAWSEDGKRVCVEFYWSCDA